MPEHAESYPRGLIERAPRILVMPQCLCGFTPRTEVSRERPSSGNASTLYACNSGRSPEMRAGAEYFAEPGEPAQRRYEALRAYFVDELPAAVVAARFGYSPAVVHQMASDLRAGRAVFFRDSRPGPKGPRKAGVPGTDAEIGGVNPVLEP